MLFPLYTKVTSRLAIASVVSLFELNLKNQICFSRILSCRSNVSTSKSFSYKEALASILCQDTDWKFR